MIDKEQLDKLHRNGEDLRKRLGHISKAIRCLQELCDHEWKNTGYDSHKDHYECSICGKTDSW